MIGLLQFFIRFAMELCEVVWLIFMTVCTIFVISMIIRGDIRISIIWDEDKKI